MKQMGKRVKRILAAVFLLVLCSIPLGSYAKNAAPRAKDYDVYVDVEECEDDVLTLSFEVTNDGDDFDGYFRVIFENNSYRDYLTYYDREISFPEGETKEFTMSFPLNVIDPQSVANMHFALVDEAGNTTSLGKDHDLLSYYYGERSRVGFHFMELIKIGFTEFVGVLHPMHLGVISIFVAIYVVLAGPIGYLVLAKKEKREWYWVLVPVLAFVTVIFLFITSGSMRQSGDNIISVRLVDGTGKNNDVVPFNLYSAQAGEIQTEFVDEVVALGIVGSDSYYFEESNGDVRAIYDGTNYTVETTNHGAFYMFPGVAVMDDATAKKNAFTGDASISSSGRASGSIENNTGVNLDYVCVCKGDVASIFEGIKDGEEKKVSSLKLVSNEAYYLHSVYQASEEEMGLAFYMAQEFLYNDDKNHNVILGLTKDGEKITNDKTKEIAFTIYYYEP